MLKCYKLKCLNAVN
ncbi:hypothetical protein F383_38912 [Gossypium arboreum]|uniref:Uncharacterized protein n=1 Tax=Gossypium arboreum TaxID=29729 RepID=A0A0B0MN08_GOSAR|nr:hypothetical protein F383_38912 [Gossypium arboreum]